MLKAHVPSLSKESLHFRFFGESAIHRWAEKVLVHITRFPFAFWVHVQCDKDGKS